MKWPKILRRLYTINTDKLLADYIRALREKYPKATIVLFGSRARGDNLPYSDYDIAIILEEPGNRVQRVLEAYRVKPRELVVDVVVLDSEEIDDELIRKMLEECIILYDGLGVGERLPCKKTMILDSTLDRTT